MDCFCMRNIVLYISIFTIFNSCKPGADEVPDPRKDRERLGEFFSAATTGIISAGSPLTYVLHEPLEVTPTEEDLKAFISFEPKINYRIAIHSGMVITVTPEQYLLPDHIYEVNLQLKALDKNRYSSEISYQIKTKKQGLAIRQTALLLKDVATWEARYKVKLADVADAGKLKSCFQFSDLPWTLEKRSDTEYVLSVMMNAGDTNKSMAFDGKPIGSPDQGTLEKEGLQLVSNSEFQPVFSHHDEESNEFYVYFSQKISAAKDMTGLIQVNGKAVPVRKQTNSLYSSTKQMQADPFRLFYPVASHLQRESLWRKIQTSVFPDQKRNLP